jgi:Concanavalin A-like lectin/glucanases superfamily
MKKRMRTRAGLACVALGAAALVGSVFSGTASAATCSADRLPSVALDGVDDRISLGADPTAATTTTARTWEAWVRTTQTSQGTILSRYQFAVGSAPFHFRVIDGQASMSLQSGTSYSERRSSGAINDGEWHHLAVVWVPGTKLDMYVDGTLSNGALLDNTGGAFLGSIDEAAGVPMTLGAIEQPIGSWSTFFGGGLDDVRYSTGARYSANFTPASSLSSDASTIGLWKLDEGSGTSTASAGQVTTPATLQNGTLWQTTCPATCVGNVARIPSITLDGVNDRLDAGVDPTSASTTTARTWEGWIKTTQTGQGTILGRYQLAVGSAPFMFRVLNNKLSISLQNGSSYWERRSVTSVNTGAWTHVAAVWVPGTRLDVYVNGVKTNDPTIYTNATGTSPAAIDQATGVPLTIGAIDNPIGTWSNHFNGTVDDIRYSNNARYNANFTPSTSLSSDANAVGLWKMNEGTGSTTARLGQNTTSAVLQNGAKWEVNGCALQLDGTNDRVDLGADPTSASTTTARTWEGWIKTTQTGQGTILGRYQLAVGSAPFMFRVLNNKLSISLQNGSSYWERRSVTSVNTGAWTHVAAVWVPGTRLDVYVNGVKTNDPTIYTNATGTSPAAIDQATGVPLTIGAIDNPIGTWSNHFNGTVDDIRYSKNARYNANFTPPTNPASDANTVGLWKLNEGTGTTTATLGQSTTAGTLANGPLWVPSR